MKSIVAFICHIYLFIPSRFFDRAVFVSLPVEGLILGKVLIQAQDMMGAGGLGIVGEGIRVEV